MSCTPHWGQTKRIVQVLVPMISCVPWPHIGQVMIVSVVIMGLPSVVIRPSRTLTRGAAPVLMDLGRSRTINVDDHEATSREKQNHLMTLGR